jgi:hypothetical protein
MPATRAGIRCLTLDTRTSIRGLDAMTADDAYLRRASELVREQLEQFEGPVATLSCTPAEGRGAGCEVVLADGRTATCVVDVEEGEFAYFVRFGAADLTEPTDRS